MSEASDWTPPMLASTAKEIPTSGIWSFEQKFDGHRWIAVRDGDVVRIRTRNGNEVSDPHVVAAIRMQEPERFIVDGERVAGQFGGTEDHAYHLFDLLQLDGVSLREEATSVRQSKLAEAFFDIGVLRVSPVHGDGAGLLEQARDEGWEGIIAKRADATYMSGRSRHWLKIKCMQRQEFVVGGFAESDARTGLKSLLVGYHDEAGLRYAGRVGTGFSEATLRALRQALDQIPTDERPFIDPVPLKRVRWVDPILVCEVEFLEWTGDGRLRHPSFKGLRDDKAASEVVRELPPEA